MEELFECIDKHKAIYDNRRESDRFNIVTALHKERDEVNLHSRFISYLLSPTSGHGMKDCYCSLFVRSVLNLNDEQFDTANIVVLPNESVKSEYRNIDIFIVNKINRQAIIIENKIDARESNDESKRPGYRGQLERYFNTIKLGIDNEGTPCPEYQCQHVYVFYLSNGKSPSDISLGALQSEPLSWKDDHVISYSFHIRQWLEQCIEVTPENKSSIKTFISHYLKLIDRITFNDLPIEERMGLKTIVTGHLESTQYLIENFKHVKWHTVEEFWNKLFCQLKDLGYGSVKFYPPKSENKSEQDDLFKDAITQVTHLSQNVNHGVTFDLRDGTRAYISGFSRLSWGIVEPKRWAEFQHHTSSNINFSEFSSNETYKMIDSSVMFDTINAITNEIAEAESNNLEMLKYD